MAEPLATVLYSCGYTVIMGMNVEKVSRLLSMVLKRFPSPITAWNIQNTKTNETANFKLQSGFHEHPVSCNGFFCLEVSGSI